MCKSRPTRACGLKQMRNFTAMPALKSRPTRACGLKHLVLVTFIIQSIVTPHTGVWIETPIPLISKNFGNVTPHTGVWIETQRRGHSR